MYQTIVLHILGNPWLARVRSLSAAACWRVLSRPGAACSDIPVSLSGYVTAGARDALQRPARMRDAVSHGLFGYVSPPASRPNGPSCGTTRCFVPPLRLPPARRPPPAARRPCPAAAADPAHRTPRYTHCPGFPYTLPAAPSVTTTVPAKPFPSLPKWNYLMILCQPPAACCLLALPAAPPPLPCHAGFPLQPTPRLPTTYSLPWLPAALFLAAEGSARRMRVHMHDVAAAAAAVIMRDELKISWKNV
ncbi:hypothetical protein GGX14DRAFT_396677 [Mycena pura]|uniref:Uncharacterized protein n=1 Tax=Mycena pura TaxID=153505 RepID=A0AAD6VEF1_9AGAR|nr:hypothetical protein GGX14DRAFT_396677 [Mycena pura]